MTTPATITPVTGQAAQTALLRVLAAAIDRHTLRLPWHIELQSDGTAGILTMGTSVTWQGINDASVAVRAYLNSSGVMTYRLTGTPTNRPGDGVATLAFATASAMGKALAGWLALQETRISPPIKLTVTDD